MADTYYHGMIRKYLLIFGSLFNQIYIDRVDSDGVAQKRLKIPLSYGPKEWYLSRLNDNPELTKPVNKVLPRIAYDLVSLRYAAERKLNTTNKFTTTGGLTSYRGTMSAPVPYDLHIRMSIITRNADDATRIVEQIVPRFTPELTVTLKSVPQLDITNDIPIVLANVEVDDQYEGAMNLKKPGGEEDRVVTWNLDFVMKGYFYGPLSQSTVIKEIDLRFIAALDESGEMEAVRLLPGMDLYGQPTTDPTQSIDKDLIEKDDNWGYIVEFLGLGSYAFTSPTQTTPGTSPNTMSFIPSPSQMTTITFIIDGGGDAAIPGVKGDLIVPFPCIIQNAALIGDEIGSCAVDIWRTSFSNLDGIHPNVSDSIIGPNQLQITNDVKFIDTALIGWNTKIQSEDVLRFNLKSCTNIQRLTISLKVLKTS